ncbi:hypothetical protein [Methylobacterium variabile]|uniref:hypothetical protein n=1 Tax=Methylobacterium variabile TaxID=298794 RepID=UPI000AF1CDEA|nr:hypothetical protein [Methylobacterium variabile]
MLWGFSLQFWQVVVFWLWAASAVGGGVAVVAALGSSVISYYISDETQRVADRQIAAANESAGKANERAATLEVKAAESSERAAKSEQNVAQLNLHIEKMRLPRTFDEPQRKNIARACSVHPNISYSMASVQGNQESVMFMMQMHDVLKQSGWRQIDWTGYGFNGKPRNDMQITGTITATGVVVGYHKEASEAAKSAAQDLAQSLHDAGFIASHEEVGDEGNYFQNNNNSVVIAVGNKSY